MYLAGVDACHAGWVAFMVELPTRTTVVQVIDVTTLLGKRPSDLAFVAIDIPIGLLDSSRACDKAARKLLGQPRGTSVFAAPCRAAINATDHDAANSTNLQITGRGLSIQAFGIASKIKEVDDAITPECQKWVYEVHPEVSFWALAGKRPMNYKKKSAAGVEERLKLLRNPFPEIDQHLQTRPSGVAKDDLLDAAVAAWTALRISSGEAKTVCQPERDGNGLLACICF